MNRNLSKTYALQKDLVILEGNFTVDAAGAVDTIKGAGIKTVTKVGTVTGVYKIWLEDKYNRYLTGSVGINAAVNTGSSADAPGVSFIRLADLSVQTNIKAADPYIEIQCFGPTGAPVDPVGGSGASTVVIGFVAFLRKSSVQMGNE